MSDSAQKPIADHHPIPVSVHVLRGYQAPVPRKTYTYLGFQTQ
jgi:hypothetical protein